VIEQNWQELIKPKKIQLLSIDGSDTAKKARLVVEPLERGYGVTLGNALRRVLLSSLQGAAVVSMKIKGVSHEFTSIKGITEDVTDIILNIKNLKLKANTSNPITLSLNVKGPKVITAADILENHNIEVLNKDLVICTVEKGFDFEMDLNIETSKGYSPVETRGVVEKEIGLILIDAFFSPVERVKYEVESSRVGQNIDYDKLYLDVETTGAVSPEDAVAFASKILQDQLTPFINFNIEEVELTKNKDLIEKTPFDKNLLKKIDELEFSVRSANCLKNDNVLYVGDLVQKTEMDMLRTPNFGRKSLNEIKEVLTKMGLHLGMQIDGWPPKNVAELAKKYEDKY
jgi:DNA-directed RNA polymerase subunit alpha